MSLIFNPTGHIVVVNPHADENYEEATITIPTIATDCPAGSVFLQTYSYDEDVVYGIQKTLLNKFFFYSSGTEYKPLVVNGIAFNPNAQCGNESSVTAFNILRTWFNNRHAYLYSNYMRTIEITLGTSTMTAILVGLHIEQPYAHVPVFKFSIKLIPTNFA